MNLHALARWHWMVIGTALGLLIGFAWSAQEPSSSRNLGDTAFIQAVRSLGNASDGRPPSIDSIVVYPPVEGGAKGLPVQVVTFTVPNPRGSEPARIDGRLNAEVPFRASEDNTVVESLIVARRRARQFNFERSTEPAPTSTDSMTERRFVELVDRVRSGDVAALTSVTVFQPIEDAGQRVVPVRFTHEGQSHVLHTSVPFRRDTVLDFLRQERERNASLRFRYAWERDPASAMSAGAASGFVLIGIIWPTVMRQLSRMGFGPPPPVREPREPKKKRGKHRRSLAHAEPAAAGIMPRELSAEDRNRLEQYTHDLEQEVESHLHDGQPGPANQPTASSTPQPIRDLRPEPVQQVEPEKPEEPKVYQGEWYPVARPIHKDDGEHHDTTKH